MKTNFTSKVSTKVVAWFTILGTIAAIIGLMTAVDQRYARADDVTKTQAEMYKSIKLLNVGVELVQLRGKRLELKGEKRQLVRQLQEDPRNLIIKEQIRDVRDDLTRVNHRIGELENKRIEE